MRNLFVTLLILSIFCSNSIAQEKWDLKKCIFYGMENNLSVKQMSLQEKFTDLSLKQSKLAILPNLNFADNTSFNSGRRQNPTNFTLITQSSITTGMQLQSSADIFNWFSKKNTIAANEWEMQAAKANTDKLKNDIALAVANFYLQVLLAKEQENITTVQLQQSQAQLSNTRKMVDAGALPELNAAELEAQVARDSANVIAAAGNITTAILNLKAYMSIPADQPFDIESPTVDKIPVDPIADLQPDAVYASALANLPQQRYNGFKLKAAAKNAQVSKAAMYPTIAGFGGLNTNYISIVSGNIKTDPFFKQLNTNFSQSVGININVPIFNGGSAKTNYKRSLLTINNLELQKEIDNQKIKQDIYGAYNNALVALEKFNAGKKTLDASERTYNFAKKRYDVGMLATFELITNQNNLLRAKLEYVLNQFDYVFKMKVLEFYKGQGLKL